MNKFNKTRVSLLEFLLDTKIISNKINENYLNIFIRLEFLNLDNLFLVKLYLYLLIIKLKINLEILEFNLFINIFML